MGRIHTALTHGDTNALATLVDFSVLKESLREQVTLSVTNKVAQDAKDETSRKIGLAIAQGVINHLVNTYVTPSGLSSLVAGQPTEEAKDKSKTPPPDAEQLRHAFESAFFSYESASRFIFSVAGKSGEVTRFVLMRSGLDWKLNQILLPINP